MARYYHVDIARFAANADAKWVDNLLSHFNIPGVENARQGLARRISDEGVYHITLIRSISRELALSTGASVSLATRLLSAESGSIPVVDGITVNIDRTEYRRAVDSAIASAVESITPARRGRPPGRASNP